MDEEVETFDQVMDELGARRRAEHDYDQAAAERYAEMTGQNRSPQERLEALEDSLRRHGKPLTTIRLPETTEDSP